MAYIEHEYSVVAKRTKFNRPNYNKGLIGWVVDKRHSLPSVIDHLGRSPNFIVTRNPTGSVSPGDPGLARFVVRDLSSSWEVTLADGTVLVR